MKRLSLILLLSGVFAFNTYAQEPRIYSQFFMNPFIYNPSYAGVDGHSVLFLMYRQQWTGIEGAPTIAHASFHTPLPNGIGVGGSIFNESQGLLTNSGVKGAVSYLLNIDRTHYLRFGLSLGVGTTSLNFAELDDPTDPAFTNLVSDELYTIGEFGVTYHTGHFNFGFALPSLFSFDVVSEEDFSPVRVTPLDRALLKMNYRGHLGDDFAFEPHVIYRYSRNNADQFEIAAIMHLKHIVWVGGAYRQDAGMVGLIGAKVAEKFALGYAYELGKPDIPALTGNTHEIHIGYHLGTRKDHAEHVSSFIKSHRLTAEERAAKAEQERLAKLEALAAEDKDTTEDTQEEQDVDQSDDVQERDDVQDQNDSQTEEAERTQQDYTNTTVINPENINKEDLRETWVYVNPSADDNLTRVSPSGEIETAVVFTRINENGEKETMVEFLPDPPPGSKTTWSIANPNETPQERVNANGEKEVGIEWVEIDENGEEKRITKWSKVYTGEVETQVLLDDMAPGYTIPDNSEVPVINIEERIKPNEKVEELKIEFDNTAATKERVNEVVAEPETTTQTTAPVVRKRGNHRLELPAGHHIIDGAFSSFENAEKQSDILFQRGFTDVKVGYQSERGLYYVVISSHQDVAEARSRRDQIRKNANYADVWVLSVGN